MTDFTAQRKYLESLPPEARELSRDSLAARVLGEEDRSHRTVSRGK